MSIKDPIFSPSQAKVDAWVFGQPDRSYHLSELAKLTGLASASLQREINRLLGATRVIGNG
jgi:DNA-binding MarR family transcriptional regulator